MPPFKGSRDAHETVNAIFQNAEDALEASHLEENRHAFLNGQALGIMMQHGIYSEQDSVVVTPWVYNPELEDGKTRTAYQLRADNKPAEAGAFGEIRVVVRVSRPNPINPNALITYEETRGIVNAPVFFTEGDIEEGTYVQRQGLGLESGRPSSVYVLRTRIPVKAQAADTDKFRDAADTLSLIEQTLSA